MTTEQRNQALEWLQGALAPYGEVKAVDAWGEEYRVGKYWWRDRDEEDYEFRFVPEGCSFGDYDNSCFVERSNVKALEKLYPDISGVEYGSYGYAEWWTDPINFFDNAEFRETIEKLNDYPLVDDDLYSEMECEAKSEQWSEDFGGEEQLKDALKKKYPVAAEVIDAASFPLQVVEELAEDYPVDENGQFYFGRMIERFIENAEVPHE